MNFIFHSHKDIWPILLFFNLTSAACIDHQRHSKHTSLWTVFLSHRFLPASSSSCTRTRESILSWRSTTEFMSIFARSGLINVTWKTSWRDLTQRWTSRLRQILKKFLRKTAKQTNDCMKLFTWCHPSFILHVWRHHNKTQHFHTFTNPLTFPYCLFFRLPGPLLLRFDISTFLNNPK